MRSALELERGSCVGKRTHLSHREASQVARTVSDRSGEDVRAYHRPFCLFFHVGHPPNGERRKELGRLKQRQDGYSIGWLEE